jgi:hypothetical protein
MKKLGFLGLIIIMLSMMVGCSTVPASVRDQFEGVWMKDDGATFTFTGNKYEFLDMENGVAGYGSFRVEVKDGVDRIRFTNDYVLNLKRSTDAFVSPNTGAGPKEFQIRALEEYHNAHPEEFLALKEEKLVGGTKGYQNVDSGGWPVEYTLDGNLLTIKAFVPPRETYYHHLYGGEFTRQ